MKKTSIMLMIASVLSKIVGFLREKVLSSVIGTNHISDAFLAAYSLPSQFFSVITAALVTGFIPMFTRIEQDKGTEKSKEFFNNNLNLMIAMAFVFALILFIFTEFVVGILLPEASEEMLVYVIPFIKITGFSIILTSIIQIMSGFLQIKGSFLLVALIGFPLNAVLISIIFLTRNLGVDILPFGVIMAYALQVLIIFSYAYSKGFRYKPLINVQDHDLQRMILLSLPLIISSASVTLGNLFNQGLASGYNGGISQMNYATKIGLMVEGIFGSAIITVMYPSVSKAIAMNKFDVAKKEFNEALISVILLILPCSIGLALLGKPIAQFVYLGGKTTIHDTQIIGSILSMYAIGLLMHSLHLLIVRAFYSFQDMKTPMITSIMIISAQIILGLALNSILGIKGITLAMSIAYILGVVIEYYLFTKKFDDYNYKELFGQLVKIIIANAVMLLAIILFEVLFKNNFSNTLFVCLSILIAGIIYLILVILLHIETFENLILSFKTKR